MNWKSIDETPSLSRPMARASAWLAELVLVAAFGILLLKPSPAAAPATSDVPAEPPRPAADLALPAPRAPEPVKAPETAAAPPPAPEPAEAPAPSVRPPEPIPAPRAPEPTKAPESMARPAESEYRREWRGAAARAAQRDLDGAVALARRAGRASEEARREAAEDLADFDRLRAFEARAAKRFAALARGSRVELDVRGRGLVAGQVVAADAERVDLLTDQGPQFVEFVDLSWATLAGWGDEDARAVVLARLLAEGGEDGDRALPKPDAPSPLEGLEREARALLYEAERGFRRPATRGAAVARYRLLLSDFPTAAVVRRSMPRIMARSRLPEELYFAAADLRGSGTFVLRPEAWRTEGAVDLARARHSFVEGEFEAEAGVAYRAFVRLGGCCERTLHAYAQASGLEKPHPARGGKVALEPGSIYAQILRRPPGALPEKHVDGHAVAWMWIEIPLPVYATPGTKRVRILTDREGLRVAGLLVSTSRQGPPSEAELRAIEAARDVE